MVKSCEKNKELVKTKKTKFKDMDSLNVFTTQWFTFIGLWIMFILIISFNYKSILISRTLISMGLSWWIISHRAKHSIVIA